MSRSPSTLFSCYYLEFIFIFYFAHAEILTSPSEEKTKDKQIQEAKTDVGAQGPTSLIGVQGDNKKSLELVSKQAEVDMAAPASSPLTSSPVRGKDDWNITVPIENQGGIFYLYLL